MAEERTIDSAKEQTQALWRDAKEGARSMLDEQKRSAASGIGDLADALRTSARNLNRTEQATVARLAQSAADGLDHLSGALERRDLDGWVREAETFARRRPIAFFGAAMAAGFIAVRFLKSSSQPDR
jgi:hypothetical protein